MSDENKTYSGSCGGCCVSAVLFIFIVWAWLLGAPTFWGYFNLDLFPPGISLNNIKYIGN